MSGHVGDLSPQQGETLAKFREKLKDVLQPSHDDHFLLRWLRARDFDLKKAEFMFRDALSWREKWKVDTILEDYQELEVIEKYMTGGALPGHDKSGCPIYIDPYGLLDCRGLAKCIKKTDYLRKYIYVIETFLKVCKEETEKSGKRIDQVTVIYDLENLGLKHLYKPAIDVYLEFIAMAESRYPETLKDVLVINVPSFFPIVWNIVKPFLSEATVKKVRVLAGNYREALLKYVDADQLPECYGGSMRDENGDPRCSAMINQGGTIPKEFFTRSAPTVSMTTASIGRGSTLQIEYEIKFPGSIMRWEFQTDGYDVGFGVYKRTKKGHQKAADMKEILSTERANSHLVPEDGSVVCPEVGTYVVRFDNTYSWSRSKKVHYQIDILEPEGQGQAAGGSQGHVVENGDDDEEDEFYLAEDS